MNKLNRNLSKSKYHDVQNVSKMRVQKSKMDYSPKLVTVDLL